METWDRTSYDKSRYNERRELLLDLIGRECADCGSTDRIEFDHVDSKSKEFALMSRWNRPLEQLQAEIAKCQPLCHECHLKKTLQQTSVEHGGGLSGKKNCKCAPCRSKKAEYMREWKRRKAAAKLA